MGNKSEYLEELEKQYQKKHRLKLKLERELAALKKGGKSSKKGKDNFGLPMLEHPEDLVKKAPVPPKVKKKKVSKKKDKESIIVKEEVKKSIVEQKEIPQKSSSLIDWGDLFKRDKEKTLPHFHIIHEDDLKPKTLDEAFEKKPSFKKETHEIPKDFKEMDKVFKKYDHPEVFNPKVKALELTNKVYNYLKNGKLDMAEYYYLQIQPMYSKLTGYDRKDIYDELMFLQNEFAMAKMKKFSKEVDEMPDRNYKLSTIMAKEREIDMKLAVEKMDYEEDRGEQEMELDELISKVYNHEERERERKELKRIRDIAMKEKRKVVRAKKLAKEKLAKQKKARIAKKKAKEMAYKKELQIDKKISKKIVQDKKRAKRKELELDKKISRKFTKNTKIAARKELELDRKAGKEFVKGQDKKLKSVMRKELVVEKKVMKGFKKKVKKKVSKKKAKKKSSKKKAKKKKTKGLRGLLGLAPSPKK
jgi:hypothetical protein